MVQTCHSSQKQNKPKVTKMRYSVHRFHTHLLFGWNNNSQYSMWNYSASTLSSSSHPVLQRQTIKLVKLNDRNRPVRNKQAICDSPHILVIRPTLTLNAKRVCKYMPRLCVSIFNDLMIYGQSKYILCCEYQPLKVHFGPCSGYYVCMEISPRFTSFNIEMLLMRETSSLRLALKHFRISPSDSCWWRWPLRCGWWWGRVPTGSFDAVEVEAETWRVSLYDIWPHWDPL